MKFSIERCDLTPQNPVWMSGYVQRKTRSEGVHDAITGTVIVLTINNEKVVWVSCDYGGGSWILIDEVLRKLAEKGIVIDKNHFVLGGTHTHSGPMTGPSPFEVDKFGEPEKEYFDLATTTLADAITKAYEREGEEVTAKYSNVIIDGLYSNRNDKNKLSDKNEYMIGFFNKEDKLLGVYHLMAHHCTVVGAHSMLLSADLFGALRKRLEQHFGVYFLMAQGNAGDMGNRQYRDGNDFAALDREADSLFAQIVNKMKWVDINMDGFKHEDVVYRADYDVDYSGYGAKYEEYKARLEKETNVDMIKHLTGWVAMAARKMNKPNENIKVDMAAEIVTMGDLQIVLVPGELGSVLGLRIKEASKAKLAFVWGYNNGCNLGYMIEKEAFSTESQESQVTNYIAGVCDEYIEEIKKHL